MFELFSGSLLYSICKDALASLRGRKRRLTQAEVLALRAKWKAEIEERLWKRQKDGLSDDIIIRDVRRMDDYPDVRPGRGISPWFKAGLMGTYHRGILVGLQWYGMKQEADGAWRRVDYKKDEKADLNAILIGRVRYENIETIDWDGDHFYSEPHIYCHFVESRRQPYEELVYCERCTLGSGREYFRELALYHAVRKLSRKRGIK